MSVSNYDKMQEAARKLFLTYDQSVMVEKFRLEQDENYLYLPCLGRLYRIERASGIVQWLDESGAPHTAGFNDGMAIYDILCYSKPNCCLSGRYGPINSVASSYHTSGLGESLFGERATAFAEKSEKLEQICKDLGGVPEGKGDIAYRLDLFPFFPIRLQFWMADDEFPASIQLHWDMNTLDYVHYETTYYIAGYVFNRLLKLLEQARVLIDF